jgi:proteasome lid subunit RPN8/RPN11
MPVFFNKLHNLFRRRQGVVVDEQLWRQIIGELAARGHGDRESGAFLLGQVGSGRVRRVFDVIYYDDLDERCLTGGISFDGSAYGRLWDQCGERGLPVIADVHTHPGPGVAQSSTDRAHPMIAQAGHIALIVPDFAQHTVSPSQVGVHEYLGDGEWDSHLGRAAARRFHITKGSSWLR